MDDVGTILKVVYEIIKEHVPKHEKSPWFNHKLHEVRYGNRKLIYGIGTEWDGSCHVIMRIHVGDVGPHRYSSLKAGPMFFKLCDPDLFENIDKFIRDNAHD